MARIGRLVLLAVVFTGGLHPPLASGDDKGDDRTLGRKFDRVELTGLDGKTMRLDALKGKQATVVVFLSFECPVSNSYTSILTELAKAGEARGVAFVGVCPTDDSAEQVRKRAEENKVSFPVFVDPKRAAAKAMGATITPEALVLDAGLALRYRGRIDDGWTVRLRRNIRPESNDLKDTIDAVLANKEVRAPLTKAVGCPIGFDDPAPAKVAAVTFHRDVLPILQNRCQSCHRSGEVGPFSLTTYKQAKAWAGDIKEYTRTKQMPPWMPTDGPEFKNERKLTAKEIARLGAWADAGAPEGDAKDAPPPVKFADGWRMGQPDLVLTPKEEFHLGPNGKDVFRCFVIPTGLTEDRWVVGYDIRPGNPRVVHHTLHFYDTSGTARELEKKEREREKKGDEADRGPGYPVAMGVGFRPTAGKPGEPPPLGGLGGWAPGQMPHFVPEGAGWLLPKGSDFIIQTHYHRNGRAETDRSKIGLYFAKKPVEQPWQTVVVNGMQPWDFIPANKKDHVCKGTVYLHADARLHSVMPHMHLLGRSVKVTMTPPGGKERVLVEIADWDYNWQETYWFKEPILAPAGTKLVVEAVFDNTSDNPNNPFAKPRPVFNGEQTTNEMLFAFIGATSTKTPWERVRGRPNPPEEKK